VNIHILEILRLAMATSIGARLQRKAARTDVSVASHHSFRRCYGSEFTTPGAGGSAVPLIKEAIANGGIFRAHAFEYACARNDIEHRTTKARHPWTNGQVERMNRTIKDATVKRFYYESHDQLRTHLADFVAAYNFARRLKTLKGLTPYEFICKAWASQPERFKLNPLQQMPGPNTPAVPDLNGAGKLEPDRTCSQPGCEHQRQAL
ncbi:integrase core domain-containing protein, partial [Mesorhizobium sp. IMUNJ 23033]|uniref:integrase core domain-containing protein n=1 Tax=Mesorhizobium sp. IMUNJ 23033 TaxID=3378039 RepID=UPI003850CE42